MSNNGATVPSNCGGLMEVICQAAEQANANPHTPIRIRMGPYGTEHQIMHVKAVQDQRGLYLLLEADLVPVGW